MSTFQVLKMLRLPNHCSWNGCTISVEAGHLCTVATCQLASACHQAQLVAQKKHDSFFSQKMLDHMLERLTVGRSEAVCCSTVFSQSPRHHPYSYIEADVAPLILAATATRHDDASLLYRRHQTAPRPCHACPLCSFQTSPRRPPPSPQPWRSPRE